MPKKLPNHLKAKSRYNNDCSIKGVAINFMKIQKESAIRKPISSGIPAVDIKLKSIPAIGKYINLYNNSHQTAATIAHGINAYRESCRNSKKK